MSDPRVAAVQAYLSDERAAGRCVFNLTDAQIAALLDAANTGSDLVSGAPAELWMRPRGVWRGGWYQTDLHDEPDAVRYVRADLYEALLARLGAQQLPGELGP